MSQDTTKTGRNDAAPGETSMAEQLEVDASLNANEGVRKAPGLAPRESNSGAVLGVPGAEHGAYGMLREPKDVTLADERRVRGTPGA